MKTFVKPGHEINFTAGANVASGEVVVAGFLVGVSATAVLSGNVGVMEIQGVHQLPKETSLVVAQGDKLFYDAGAKKITKTVGANAFIGYADAAELAASVTVRVLLARSGV